MSGYLLNAQPGSQLQWLEGTIVDRSGPLTYRDAVAGLNRHVHIEHLCHRNISAGIPE